MVLYGDTEVMRLSADIVAENRLMWRPAEILPFPEHIFETGFPGERPDLRVNGLTAEILEEIIMYVHTVERGRRRIDFVEIREVLVNEVWQGFG